MDGKSSRSKSKKKKKKVEKKDEKAEPKIAAPPLMGDSGLYGAENMVCMHHGEPLTLYCLSCEEPCSIKCASYGPHNNSVTNIFSKFFFFFKNIFRKNNKNNSSIEL